MRWPGCGQQQLHSQPYYYNTLADAPWENITAACVARPSPFPPTHPPSSPHNLLRPIAHSPQVYFGQNRQAELLIFDLLYADVLIINCSSADQRNCKERLKMGGNTLGANSPDCFPFFPFSRLHRWRLCGRMRGEKRQRRITAIQRSTLFKARPFTCSSAMDPIMALLSAPLE